MNTQELQQDRRLVILFEELKARFMGSHPLLGKPYPANFPAPIWNPNLGLTAGKARVKSGVIQLNPHYLLPFERADELYDTLLHEMLHNYVYAYFQCRGHKCEWATLAKHWNLEQFHCMQTFFGSDNAQRERHSPLAGTWRITLPATHVPRFKIRRVLP